MRIEATIYVEPKGKARPRVMRKGDRVWAYTPADTMVAEDSIRESLVKLEQEFPANIPLRLKVTFYRQKPKSTSKRVAYPVTRPDLDQYIKLLLDACQKYIFPDDAAIVSLEARKRFGTPPKIVMVLEEEPAEAVKEYENVASKRPDR